MNKICYGCGVKLQNTDKEKIGYTPKEDANYCMRCFRLMHYGENVKTNTPKDKKEIINKINKDNKFVIFLVDFLNINENVISIFKSIKKKKLLVINKCELLPSHIKKERLISYLINYYKIKDPIKLKGSNKKRNEKIVINYLIDNNIKEAYILGISNSGKSTLINDLLKLSNSNLNMIAVSNKANTTLDFIRVKINDDITLIDSPGFIVDNYINSDVTGKNITAYSFNMKECETLSLIDNQYFIKFDAPTPITFYTNINTKKDIKKYFKAAPNLNNKIVIDKDNMDIIIYGIGFITIKKKVNITTNIDSSNIEVRTSMFGGCYE